MMMMVVLLSSLWSIFSSNFMTVCIVVIGLMDAIAQFGGFDETHLASFGRKAGTERMMLLAEAAEKNRPQLAQFDAYGE